MLTREITVLDPRTGETVGRVPIATPQEVERALRRARAAADGWARTPAAERAAALHAAASAVRDAADELAASNERETGKPFDDARGGVDAGIGTLVQYAELGPVHRGRTLHGSWDATDFMVPGPRGVVAVLTPWNDPVAVAAGLLGAALVTGNTVVHKPSERCPLTGRRFAELLAAHLPEGVLEILDGDGSVGAQLAAGDVDVVAHVGSTATGRAIALDCARTGAKAVLENGGNDPLIVDEGVDPVWAASQAALGAFANAGQICVSVERIYCHAALADPFLAALTAEAAAWQERLGPLVDRRHRDHVHGQVTEALAAGARTLTGGEVPDGQGSYYPPTVLIGCTPADAGDAGGDLRAGRPGAGGPGLRRRAARGGARRLRPRRHRPHPGHGARTGRLARAAGRHREDQRRVRRGAGRCRAAAPGERLGLRVRAGTARRDDHHEGGARRRHRPRADHRRVTTRLRVRVGTGAARRTGRRWVTDSDSLEDP